MMTAIIAHYPADATGAPLARAPAIGQSVPMARKSLELNELFKQPATSAVDQTNVFGLPIIFT
jgi:hypothetical protein